MSIKVKRLRDNAIIPTKGSPYSAGYDLHAAILEPLVIPPQTVCKIPTGLAFEIPVEKNMNVFGAIFARSGLATKENLRPTNCVGVCDADFRGEYVVALFNDSPIESRTIQPNERIAQLVFIPYINTPLEVSDSLSETVRGTGGFGSTGK